MDTGILLQKHEVKAWNVFWCISKFTCFQRWLLHLPLLCLVVRCWAHYVLLAGATKIILGGYPVNLDLATDQLFLFPRCGKDQKSLGMCGKNIFTVIGQEVGEKVTETLERIANVWGDCDKREDWPPGKGLNKQVICLPWILRAVSRRRADTFAHFYACLRSPPSSKRSCLCAQSNLESARAKKLEQRSELRMDRNPCHPFFMD